MAETVLVIADCHVGSTVAPWPKGQHLADGGTWGLNKYQTYLNKCFQQLVKEAVELKPDRLVLLGDIIQGVSPKDGQLVSNRWGIQCQAATRLLEPLVALVPEVYYLRGTEYHEGKSSEAVDGLATMLGCKPHPTTGSPTWRRLYLEMGNGVVDFIHAVSTTSIRQYSLTAIVRNALNHRLELDIKYGRKIKPLIGAVRAHAHIYAAGDVDGVTAVRCPAWQMSTAFVDARGNSILSDIGYVVLKWDGALNVEKRLFQQPLPHVEKGKK